jgi:nucleotide-binding universal stress UspA family protein
MNHEAKPYVVVVGIDYSETGDLAFERALEVASLHRQSQVHVVNVVHLVVAGAELAYAPATVYSAISMAEAEEQLARHVERKVEEFRSQRGPEGRVPDRVVPHLRLAAPAQEIAQLASDLEANLVVVGTHGRRALSRVLIGSVAEVVVRLAPCEVLVVRPRQSVEVPKIEPPCRACLKTREATHGERFWCDQHSARHGQRHTYGERDRVSDDGTMPLVFHG